MNEEELLAELDNNEPAFQEDKLQSITKSSGNSNFKRDREDLWKKSDFKAKKLSVEDFKKSGKAFMISYYGNDSKVSDEIVSKFTKVAKYLINKGFIFRHTGSKDSKIQNEILAISDINYQSYLPWGKFNTNIKKPVFKSTPKDAYEYACNYHSKFNTIPYPAIRAKLGAEIAAMFTEKFNNPIDLLICYNENGDEVITKDVKYKELGNISFPIRVANDNNIAVFNLQKEDSITRIVEFVKNMD